jgi:hypothetical protein
MGVRYPAWHSNDPSRLAMPDTAFPRLGRRRICRAIVLPAAVGNAGDHPPPAPPFQGGESGWLAAGVRLRSARRSGSWCHATLTERADG